MTENTPKKSIIPPLAEHFAQQSGHDLIQRDLHQRPYMLAGPMFFVFSYWLFQTGGLLGYGLKGRIEIISKLLFDLGADPKDVEQYLGDESAALLAKPKSPPASLLELYLVPLLASVGIDFHDKEFIEGKKSSWSSEKQYDMDTLDKNAYLALRQGVAMGFLHPDVFRQCWEKTYAAESKEEWAEAFKKGLVDSPTQEIVLFPEEVSRVLGEVAKWSQTQKDAPVSKDEIEEIERRAKEFKG
jgi:hypothetical protein